MMTSRPSKDKRISQLTLCGIPRRRTANFNQLAGIHSVAVDDCMIQNLLKG